MSSESGWLRILHGNQADLPRAAGFSPRGLLSLRMAGWSMILLAAGAWTLALISVAVIQAEGEQIVLGQGLRFTWWVVAFEFLVLLAGGFHLAVVGARFDINNVDRIGFGPAAISGTLAVVTALTMLETQRWNSVRINTDKSHRLSENVDAVFAGFLAHSALNTVLILILGSHPSHPTRSMHLPVGRGAAAEIPGAQNPAAGPAVLHAVMHAPRENINGLAHAHNEV